jgi:diguanylate cyclase (GGDEF)-like protein
MYDAIETVFEVLVDRFSALMPHYSVGLYLSKGESNRVMRSQLHGVSDEDLAYIKKNYNHLTHMENTTSLEDEFQLPKDWHVFNKKYSIINHSGDVNYNLMMLLIGEQIEAYHVGFIQIFMEQVSGNIRMREQTKQLDLFAKTDQLTQLYNRNAYKQEMDDIVRKYQKEHPYSLVFGDVNGLKRINDTYGHTDGDLLLKICSEVIRKTIPVYRKVFRFGGDEVVILLEDTTLEEAQSIEQELKVAFAEKRMLCTNEVTGEQVYERVSMSFGSVSSFEGTPDELIDLADARMRRMKDAYYLENGIQKYR